MMLDIFKTATDKDNKIGFKFLLWSALLQIAVTKARMNGELLDCVHSTFSCNSSDKLCN